jgi:hypothetical protein
MEKRKEPRATDVQGKQRNPEMKKKTNACKLKAAAFTPQSNLTY